MLGQLCTGGLKIHKGSLSNILSESAAAFIDVNKIRAFSVLYFHLAGSYWEWSQKTYLCESTFLFHCLDCRRILGQTAHNRNSNLHPLFALSAACSATSLCSISACCNGLVSLLSRWMFGNGNISHNISLLAQRDIFLITLKFTLVLSWGNMMWP